MLNYTRAAFRKIINDIKKIRLLFEFSIQFFMVVYLFYSIFTNSATRITNIFLLALTLIYLFFWFKISKNGFTKEEKKLKKQVEKIFKYIKLGFGFYTLCFTIYGIYTNIATVDFISLLLTVFTVISFVIKILLLLLEYIANYYKELVLTAIKTDVSNVLKPVTTVKKLFGKDTDEPAEPTKERLILDKLVEEKKQERQAQKEERKQQKIQQKQEEKLYKAQLKHEKRLQKQADKENALTEIAVTEQHALPPAVSPALPPATEPKDTKKTQKSQETETPNEPQETQPPRKKSWWKFGKKDD